MRKLKNCYKHFSLSSIPLFFLPIISHQARTIFEKSTKVNYKQVDDLAGVWCEYGEMELRHENYDQALRILRVRRTNFLVQNHLTIGTRSPLYRSMIIVDSTRVDCF